MTDRTPINVVFTADNEHAMLTGVAVKSLVSEFAKSERRGNYFLEIYIISLAISEHEKASLLACGASLETETHVHFIDYELRVAEMGADRFAEIITIGFRLPDLFPTLDRIIALDADVMVTGDISLLWQVDLDGCWMAAVPCLLTDDHVSLKNYNYPFKIKYDTVVQPVNAGVFVMDLKEMRRARVTDTLVRWTKENANEAMLVNQEAIAVSYPQQWKALAHEWNFRLFAEPYWTSSWASFQRYARLTPKLVHFQKGVRPHKILAVLPYFQRWIEHCDNTPWRVTLRRKRMNYLMFVYFEYFRLFGWMNLVWRSQTWKLRALSLAMLPFALPRYLLYCCRPLSYRFRIAAYIPPLSEA
jgi:lipopolysaccharide biosynthesis glycosyltransferase